MKKFITILLVAIISLVAATGCKEKGELKDYWVKYRVYYSESFVQEIIHHEFRRGETYLRIASNKGTNYIEIGRMDKMFGTEVVSTTAPIQVVDYSDNFVKFYR